MEIDHLHNLYSTDCYNNVFSGDFICTSIMDYFRRLGYKVQKSVAINFGGRQEQLVTASTFFRGEVIEIRGCNLDGYSSQPANQVLTETRSSLSGAIMNSFVNIGNYYRDDNIMSSIAVPNVPRFRAIVDRLQYYFTVNDLYYKVYLVNENSEVSVFHLNEQNAKR